MASHSLAISKAALAASFMRPDPTSVPRDQVAHLHELLNAALLQCSPANIQRCKVWLVQHALQSSARVTAISKYLVALSSSLRPSSDRDESGKSISEKKRGRRKQLHILYLLNDLLHSSKYHSQDLSPYSTLTGNLQPFLVELVSLAARYDAKVYKRQQSRIADLLGLWDLCHFFHPSFLQKLREAAENAGIDGGTSAGEANQGSEELASIKPSKDVPFVMPASHGDPSAPYYELPAGNMVPHVIPNSTMPINPNSMKAIQFTAGPAEEKLVVAVKNFLREADAIYGGEADDDESVSIEIDEIGQTVFRNSATGEIMGGESYYGWSKSFCEQMKKGGIGHITGSRSKSRIPSRSPSRDGSYSPRKRRRYSTSSRSLSRSRSRSRSYSPPQRFNSRVDHKGPNPRSRSRSRSPYSPPRPGFSTSTSGGRWDSPPRQAPPPPPRYPPPPAAAFNSTPLTQAKQQPSPALPFPMPFPHGIPLGPDGMPIPPPPPPNYTGPWPPPPPPPPPAGAGGIPFPPPFAGLFPPPVANPGWVEMQGQHEQVGASGYGRGRGGGGGGGGRGYGDRGRAGRGGRGGW